ncbi:NADH-quinone oxidoreductase subunit L [Dokdonella immobilis]|uniref:Probable inorganic carbon transporter subunit DabB n=1 Tax=Dokdonella immobilis TaxID=578942 RepID=A0A1I4X7R8_9GAMM|nr:NADH-quinone oxidoreductase subunit L [Dokdonella immobilis]SFN21722.1 NAD(P)H-quinone oxidoreductase subunit 5 [Dokdonella immobilis]
MIVDATVLPWASPLLYVAGALAALAIADDARRWRLAGRIAAVAPLAALATALFEVPQGARVDMIGLAMVLLVGLIGWVIVRYSARYLAGERGQRRYVAATLLTLAAVCTVALSQHLGLLVAAWIASSLALHPLLTFFRERPQALVVAHKKFIASRLAELCLLGALALIHAALGTLALPAITNALVGAAGLPVGLQAAALLVALAVILKSAQLPVHGWLIQVMEAPTPVSALLHAGIVNLGGFVLIRLAALIGAVPAAQTLLVVVGSLTAVLAGLIMMTRISIKVRLAWSTCAQMGFMLMECGLGLYELALLHLVAHSLYKAHAFLGAGGRVADYRQGLLGERTADRRSAGRRIGAGMLAAVFTVTVVGVLAAAWSAGLQVTPLPWIVSLILGLGLTPLLGATLRELPRGLLRVAAVVLAYLAWHAVAGSLMTLPAAPPPTALALWAAACFVALYGVQTVLRSAPQGRLARTLHAPIHAGLHLDERFQRLTLRIWPAPRVTANAALRSRIPITEPSGEHR